MESGVRISELMLRSSGQAWAGNLTEYIGRFNSRGDRGPNICMYST
jgi:hypothetical protein